MITQGARLEPWSRTARHCRSKSQTKQRAPCVVRSHDRDYVPRFSSKHRIWEMNARLCPTSYRLRFAGRLYRRKLSGLLFEVSKIGDGYFTEVFSQAPYAGNYRRSGTFRELHTTQYISYHLRSSEPVTSVPLSNQSSWWIHMHHIVNVHSLYCMG